MMLIARWPVRAVVFVLAVTAILGGTAVSAEAHDNLIVTSPSDGSVTSLVPAKVTMTFNQPALAIGTVVIVTGPAGQAQTGKPVLSVNSITQRLRADSPAGRYKVAWRVTSADGHPVTGQFSFTAKAASQPRTTPPTAPSAASTRSTAATPSDTTSNTVTSSVTSSVGSAPASTAKPASRPWWVVAGGILVIVLMTGLGYRATHRTHDVRQD